MELFKARGWRALLRYRTDFWGTKSEVDSSPYFFAKDGKLNARSELIASVQALFGTPATGDPNKHPQCRFPARYMWLRLQLKPRGPLATLQPCPEFLWWRNRFQAHSATMVFASHYLSNPASMFGHLLLRINSRKKSDVLNYGVNYGAIANIGDGVMYYIKGMSGMYPGVFGILPYYQKVQEYSNFESRDIWEYELNLTGDELQYLIAHIWEMRDQHFDYFFFDENCAYHLLALIEVVKPEAKLVDRLGPWVDPASSIKAMQQARLLKEPKYRPSSMTKLRSRVAALSPSERAVYTTLISKPLDKGLKGLEGFATERRAAILDAAIAYFNYHGKENGDGYKRQTSRLQHRLLIARSSLAITSKPLAKTPRSTRPDIGHAMGLVSFAGGASKSEPFLDLGFRPAYHGFLSNPAGYKEYTEIVFPSAWLRYDAEAKVLTYKKLTIVDVKLLSPFDYAARKPSLEGGVTFERSLLASCNYCKEMKIRGGIGLSSYLGAQRYALPFALLFGKGAYSQRTNGLVGAGMKVGISSQYWSAWRGLVYFERMVEWRTNHINYASTFEAASNVSLGINWELQASYLARYEDPEWQISSLLYF